jgi:glycosyltransferase involved in cell wall biosynthesis
MRPDLLALAIPTYNRPEILHDNLRGMLPEIQRLGVPVYISDDSPGNETEVMVAALRQRYERIYYRRNTPGLGHDLNFVATIQLPESDYIWYLGDSIVIDAGALEKVHTALSTFHPDLLFVNSESRCVDNSDCCVPDLRVYLQRSAWHLTLTGATVYSREAVLSVRERDVARWKNFPQLGLIFQFGLAENRMAYWMGSCGVSSNRNKKSYWTNAVVTTFAVDWVNLLRNFAAAYTAAQLREIFLSHSLKTDTFAARNIVIYRLNNGFPFKLVWKYRNQLKLASHTPYPVLVLISLLPVAAWRWVKRCLRYIKHARA